MPGSVSSGCRCGGRRAGRCSRGSTKHYAGFSPRLHFELLNEPHEPMRASQWNSLLADALAVVRSSNSDRLVLVGPMLWNTFGVLDTVDLPTRARWLTHVRSLAEEYGIGWSSWDFGTDFGAYDLAADRWRPELLTALLPR